MLCQADFGMTRLGDYGAFIYVNALAMHATDDGSAMLNTLTKCDEFSWCYAIKASTPGYPPAPYPTRVHADTHTHTHTHTHARAHMHKRTLAQHQHQRRHRHPVSVGVFGVVPHTSPTPRCSVAQNPWSATLI